MNRAGKRRQEREKENSLKTYTLNAQQMDKLKEDAEMAATERSFIIMMGFSMMTMRDEFGFGEKRLNQFISKVMSIYAAYENNYLTLNDMHEVIAKETGIELRDKLKWKD